MKKILLFGFFAGALAASCTNFGNSLVGFTQPVKIPIKLEKIVYYNPEISPEIEEIKIPTYQAFFSAMSDELLKSGEAKLVRTSSTIKYNQVTHAEISEMCYNNNAQAVIVPKIKYFKVGFGKYVFSNQVVVSLKLYDEKGNFIMETSYDTYKGNARLVGTAENSIKIGTKGAFKKMAKELRKRNLVTP